MTTTPASPTPSPTRQPIFPWASCLLWILFALNAVLRLSAGSYHAFGVWVALSVALGLNWLARRYRLPALKYFAAGGIAMAILMLGLEIRAGRAASQARHLPPAAATK